MAFTDDEITESIREDQQLRHFRPGWGLRIDSVTTDVGLGPEGRKVTDAPGNPEDNFS